MTVVAAFLMGGIPFVMGDMLVSGPELTDREILIPTVGPATEVFPSGSGYSIVGMQQKVFILSEDLAVACSGTAVAAKALIAELSSVVRAGQMTVASLNLFLRNDARSIVSGFSVSLVGAFRDSAGVRLFRYNAQNLALPGFEDANIAGIGADAVAKLISDLPPSLQIIRGTPHPLEEAVIKALTLTGLLLHLEIGTHDSLRTYYGGAYELATLIGGRFSKIDDVIYTFWYAKVHSEGVRLNLPHAYMKLAYKDDALLIRSFHVKDNPETQTQTLDESMHVYPNFLSPARQWSIKDRPTMNSRFVCSYVFVDNPPQSPAVLCTVDFEPSGSTIFKFDDSGEKTTVAFRKDFVDHLARSVSEDVKRRNDK